MREDWIKNWVVFDGSYEKDPCYIRLTDGKEYGPCYPNSDTFHSLVGEFATPVKAKRVTHVAYVDWDIYMDWLDQVREQDEALQEQVEQLQERLVHSLSTEENHG